MKKIILTFASIALVASFSLTSCKKDKEALYDQSAVDNAKADAQFNDLDNITTDAMISNDDNLGLRGEEVSGTSNFCGAVTINTTTKTIVIDFGAGTTCDDGRTRKGKINITYTGRYLTPGTVITTTPQEYYVNGVKIEGTKTVTNISTSDTPTHRVQITGGKITDTDGTSVTWNATRKREWLSGYGDFPIINAFNDTFRISSFEADGTIANGTNRQGKAYTTKITKPLVVETACFLEGSRKFTEGTYSVISESSTRTIDFGNGECGGTITVTLSNLGTFTFTVE
ncbi:MAG: hypothetical protein SFU27_03595 [Thermonemataceae bacterium]|nr:hypothetical protein [Thermonemataceae bacterium]